MTINDYAINDDKLILEIFSVIYNIIFHVLLLLAMEKYINISELLTYQIVTPMSSDLYDTELVYAVNAGNAVAVKYMITRVPDPHYYLCDLLSITKDILVAEILLESVDFLTFRRLNAALSKIESLEVLDYILNHDIALFNMAYRKSECIRYAALINDYDRVKCFLSSRTVHPFDLCVSSLTTIDKSCVELAFYNKNDEMLKLFIASGRTYTSVYFSYELSEHLSLLRNNMCRDITVNKRKIFNLCKYEGSTFHDIDSSIFKLAFPECMGNIVLYNLKTSRLLRSVQ